MPSKKPVVVEVYHAMKHFGYARKQLYSRLSQVPEAERTVGVEISPWLIKRIGEMAEPEMLPHHKFWRDVIAHASILNARVVPLVDNKTTNLFTGAEDYGRQVAGKQKISAGSGEEGRKIMISNPKAAKRLLEMWGRAVVETDEQLPKSISASAPTISFVGMTHGAPLGQRGSFEVIPFPQGLLDGVAKEELAYIERARAAYKKKQKKK